MQAIFHPLILQVWKNKKIRSNNLIKSDIHLTIIFILIYKILIKNHKQDKIFATKNKDSLNKK